MLTYEDVANVDALGIVTARSGVNVESGGINVVGGGLTVTGVSTFFSNSQFRGDSEFREDIQFGIAGAGGSITSNGDAAFVGIVTASDGRLIAGVGINSDGTNIGYGITTLNFVGTGNTFAVRSGNTMEISIQGGGGGGGAELDVTASLFI